MTKSQRPATAGKSALALLAGLSIGLAGCSSKPPSSGLADGAPAQPLVDVQRIPDAVPRVEPPSRYGNPVSYSVLGKRYHTLRSSQGYRERGVASWYGTKFHGRLTSSREPYDMYAMTAAHRTLPLPTYARVTNLRNGKSVVLRINDRGPFHDNRLIDLSYAAAARLDILQQGTGLVEVEALDPVHPSIPPPARPDDTPVFLQIGAFGNRDNAERLRARVAAEVDAAVFIRPGRVGEDTVYRVRIGPMDSVEQVDRLTEQLKQSGIDQPHLVLAEEIEPASISAPRPELPARLAGPTRESP